MILRRREERRSRAIRPMFGVRSILIEGRFLAFFKGYRRDELDPPRTIAARVFALRSPMKDLEGSGT